MPQHALPFDVDRLAVTSVDDPACPSDFDVDVRTSSTRHRPTVSLPDDLQATVRPGAVTVAYTGLFGPMVAIGPRALVAGVLARAGYDVAP